MIQILLSLIAAVVLLIAVGLVITWFTIDDGPVFGPSNAKGRVTFKRVLQDFLRDAREVFAPLFSLSYRFWKWLAPKATNPTSWAAIIVNAALFWPYLVNNPVGQQLLAQYPVLHFVGALVAFLATRQPGAPHSVPSGGLSPTGGYVNNDALTA